MLYAQSFKNLLMCTTVHLLVVIIKWWRVLERLKTIRFSFAAAPALRENNTTRSYSNGHYTLCTSTCMYNVYTFAAMTGDRAKREDKRVERESALKVDHHEMRPWREANATYSASLILFSAFSLFHLQRQEISSFSFSSSYILSPIFEGERGGNSTESGKAFLYTDGYINSDAPPYLKQQRSYIVSVRL